NGVEQRVTQQRFSSANRTQNAGRTSGEDQVNQKEKQRLSDGANSSGPTVERIRIDDGRFLDACWSAKKMYPPHMLIVIVFSFFFLSGDKQ
uniref:Ovule protein n=1 Tax=Ascaris lumbricoides TaxID=6252 RepID=A0A0M3I6Y8_ASCLU